MCLLTSRLISLFRNPAWILALRPSRCNVLGKPLESGSTKDPTTKRANPQQDEGADTKTDPAPESGQQRDVNMEHYGIFPSNGDHIRLALELRDIQNATYIPVAGWPPYRDVFGCDPPAP